MSGQKKIKELTLQLIDADKRCKLWMDSGILLSKRITELEQQNKQLESEKAELKRIAASCCSCSMPSCLKQSCSEFNSLQKYSEVKQ